MIDHSAHEGSVNQPGPSIPLIDGSISDLLANVGKSTSQTELLAHHGIALTPELQQKVKADTIKLLARAEKLGVDRLRP